MRSCAACGKSLEGRSSRAKYCSSSCRARVSEGAVVPLERRTVASGSSSALVDATRAALADAGRDESPLGLAALELARTLSSSDCPPAAKAGLAKQLDLTLGAALKGVRVAGPMDELRRRRDEKLGRISSG